MSSALRLRRVSLRFSRLTPLSIDLLQFNPVGGWAEAERAVSVGMQMVLEQGGHIGAGMEIDGIVLGKELSSSGTKVAKGVKLKSGQVLEADLVVICTGAWYVLLRSSSCSRQLDIESDASS